MAEEEPTTTTTNTPSEDPVTENGKEDESPAANGDDKPKRERKPREDQKPIEELYDLSQPIPKVSRVLDRKPLRGRAVEMYEGTHEPHNFFVVTNTRTHTLDQTRRKIAHLVLKIPPVPYVVANCGEGMCHCFHELSSCQPMPMGKYGSHPCIFTFSLLCASSPIPKNDSCVRVGRQA